MASKVTCDLSAMHYLIVIQTMEMQHEMYHYTINLEERGLLK